MKYAALLFFLMPVSICAKVLIITYSCNSPHFIEMQDKTFKRFLNDDYEFVVFNDARRENIKQQIDDMCNQLGIRVFRIPQEIHNRPYLPRQAGDNLQGASERHVNCIQYSLDTLGFNHDDIVFLLDSDMFLIRPFSITEYMKDKDIASFIKRNATGIHYLWPGICFLNMSNLPDKRSLNFNCGRMNNWPTDSGGWTYYYLTKYPQLRVSDINSLFSHQLFLGDSHFRRSADSFEAVPKEIRTTVYIHWGFNDNEIKFLLKQPDTFEFYLDHHFIHYRGGSTDTTQGQTYHTNKWNIFTEFINEALK